jgi:iron complex transport system ATP-binding protein
MLGYFAGNPSAPAIIMVTHHVEEIPRGFTHVLLMKNGGAAYAGPLSSTLTSENLTDVFGVSVTVYNNDGRYSAQASL